MRLIPNLELPLDQNISKIKLQSSQIKSVDKNVSISARIFLQFFTTTEQNSLKELKVEFTQENSMTVYNNMKVMKKMVLFTVLLFEKESTYTLVHSTSVQNSEQFTLIESLGKRDEIVVELKCPKSFKYFNKTSQLCQYSCS